MKSIRKIYQFSQIKYPWLLIIAMLAFLIALSLNRFYYPNAETIIYGTAFLIALIWSILNYMGNVKISPIYKKCDNIETFIKMLKMEEEEKEELFQYLNDFAKDLEEKGKTHKEAIEIAISHFQVKEFTESENKIFETKAHYYLLGYASIFFGITLIIQCIDWAIDLPFIMIAISFTLILFAIAFVCLYFIYKIVDGIIGKK